MHNKSESDVMSLAASSPPWSPKRGGNSGYYVQSPSRELHDGGGYKLSSMQAMPVYNSPSESPSHPSFSRHSRASSVSRFSGNLRDGGRKGGAAGERKALNDKGWPECSVIEEEGAYEDLSGDSSLSARAKSFLASSASSSSSPSSASSSGAPRAPTSLLSSSRFKDVEHELPTDMQQSGTRFGRSC